MFYARDNQSHGPGIFDAFLTPDWQFRFISIYAVTGIVVVIGVRGTSTEEKKKRNCVSEMEKIEIGSQKVENI